MYSRLKRPASSRGKERIRRGIWKQYENTEDIWLRRMTKVWLVYSCFTSHATIFQSYMWRHRCAGGVMRKLYLRLGAQRHRHFVGFHNVPVLHRHGTTLFIRWFLHTAPFSRLLRHAGDKSLYTHIKIRKPTRQHKNATKNFDSTIVCAFALVFYVTCNDISVIRGLSGKFAGDAYLTVLDQSILNKSVSLFILIVFEYI